MSKELVLSAKVLAHYDPMLPLKLVADTLALGKGGVISLFFSCWIGASYCFASRTLIPSKGNYA